MALQVRSSNVGWWRQYAKLVRRSPQDLDELMRSGAKTPTPFPHIRLRLVHGTSEPFLPGTGLAVWEIVWVSRMYEGDVNAIARYLEASQLTHALIEEALEYARAHPTEIDPVVELVEGITVEQLRAIVPGMTVMTYDPDAPDE